MLADTLLHAALTTLVWGCVFVGVRLTVRQFVRSFQ
jgi:hypothetical protein